MNAEISETVRARMLGLSMQRKFASAGCHAHSNAHNCLIFYIAAWAYMDIHSYLHTYIILYFRLCVAEQDVCGNVCTYECMLFN